MEQEKKMRWGNIGIIIAILVLAASIFFTGMKISNTMNANVKDLRKEVISFIHAFRGSSMANRQISVEDVKKGYQFAQELLSRME